MNSCRQNAIPFLPTMSIQSLTDYLDELKMSRHRRQQHGIGDGHTYDHVDYTKLTSAAVAGNVATDDGFIDAQFILPPQQIPWKAVALAALLMIAGSAMLIIGSLVVSGHMDLVKYSDRMWPMIILGGLMFIPGAYHIRIAYYAFKKVPGYSFDDIPEFD